MRVRDAAGREGVGSGDVMYGFDDLPQHAARLANVGFNEGRPWPLDEAVLSRTLSTKATFQ